MSGTGPRTIGNFAIERELGSGGMGVVLLGRHQSLDRPAVLKRLRPDLAASEDRRICAESELVRPAAGGATYAEPVPLAPG